MRTVVCPSKRVAKIAATTTDRSDRNTEIFSHHCGTADKISIRGDQQTYPSRTRPPGFAHHRIGTGAKERDASLRGLSCIRRFQRNASSTDFVYTRREALSHNDPGGREQRLGSFPGRQGAGWTKLRWTLHRYRMGCRTKIESSYSHQSRKFLFLRVHRNPHGMFSQLRWGRAWRGAQSRGDGVGSGSSRRKPSRVVGNRAEGFLVQDAFCFG